MRTTGASYLLTSVFLLLMLFSQAQTESLFLPVFGGFHEEFGIEISETTALARRAFQQRRHELVLRLTSGFGKQHPGQPDLVENYFLAAQAMLEQKGDTTKAVGLTRKLLERFPEHPLASDMSRFEASFSS